MLNEFSAEFVINDVFDNSFIFSSGVFLYGLWRCEWGSRHWSNDGNTSDSDGLHFNTKVWQDSSWPGSSRGKIFYWIAQLGCDQTLVGWKIAILSWDLYIYLFSVKKRKKMAAKKINQDLEMRQHWLEADRSVVTRCYQGLWHLTWGDSQDSFPSASE